MCTPALPKAVIHLPTGRTFTIEARNLSRLPTAGIHGAIILPICEHADTPIAGAYRVDDMGATSSGLARLPGEIARFHTEIAHLFHLRRETFLIACPPAAFFDDDGYRIVGKVRELP